MIGNSDQRTFPPFTVEPRGRMRSGGGLNQRNASQGIILKPLISVLNIAAVSLLRLPRSAARAKDEDDLNNCHDQSTHHFNANSNNKHILCTVALCMNVCLAGWIAPCLYLCVHVLFTWPNIFAGLFRTNRGRRERYDSPPGGAGGGEKGMLFQLFLWLYLTVPL